MSTSSTKPSRAPSPSTEQTPLLRRQTSNEAQYPDEARRAAGHQKRIQIVTWTFAALLSSASITAFILFLFYAPRIGQTYALQATQINISNISAAPSVNGIEGRATVTVTVDADRAQGKLTRSLGRLSTWIVKKVEVEPESLMISAPEFAKETIARVRIPGFVVDVRNGHETVLDIAGLVEPDSISTIHDIVERYLSGRLEDIRLEGEAKFRARTGWIGLWRQSVKQSMVIKNIPSVPKISISGLDMTEIDDKGHKAVGVSASVSMSNPYPITATAPPLLFTVSIPSCDNSTTRLARAKLSSLRITPSSPISANVLGIISDLPDSVLVPCTNSTSSPLDSFLARYMHGNSTTLHISGAPASESIAFGVPPWIAEFLSTITIPIPFPGHATDSLIKRFTLTNVDLELPSPLADPSSPNSRPRLTALVQALIQLPEEMNFPIDVRRARADADVFHQGEKWGEIHIDEWVPARSRTTWEGVEVEADVERTPVYITNGRVFRGVVKDMLLNGGVELGISARVDVGMETAMGEVVVRDVEAEGMIEV
ncbi:hypothetical protein BJ508DRAFT_413837 [Ascobolus immersus RN42]|uniref:Tag1 C-terminal domain-containing protein n=1 Tax=Ascobolus immersus RN42 TaxID=1160509 RepID=A0A3N4IA03_ASCIM|nr:hypothetical protein BJ508DRAFT_413837 [Ascobolus immersus RN42]